MSKTVYRFAQPADVAPLMAFLEKFRENAHSSWDDFDMDLGKCAHFAATLCHYGIVLLAEVEGRVIGSIGLSKEVPWWSSRPTLVEHWTLVLPEFRNSKTADTLMKWAIKIANHLGMPLHMGQISGSDVKRKIDWYEAHGFKLMGANFFRDPQSPENDTPSAHPEHQVH